MKASNRYTKNIKRKKSKHTTREITKSHKNRAREDEKNKGRTTTTTKKILKMAIVSPCL